MPKKLKRRKKEEGRRLEFEWGFKQGGKKNILSADTPPQPIHAERGRYLSPCDGGELNPYF